MHAKLLNHDFDDNACISLGLEQKVFGQGTSVLSTWKSCIFDTNASQKVINYNLNSGAKVQIWNNQLAATLQLVTDFYT